jgi:class 3 adenylate cyclase
MNTFAEGERRWTAVLFTDMANFSAVTDAMGSEKSYQLMSQVLQTAVACVEDFGGTTLNFAGDSILASFGAPVAMEDASLQACRAALEFLKRIDAKCDGMERQFGVRPAFRVGISGGSVVIGRLGLSDKMDLNIMGTPVNEAARLEALAAPNQVLISGQVAAQAEGWIEIADLGERKLKGFNAPTHVFELQGLRATKARFDAQARRGLVQIIGREAELNVLQDRHRDLPDAVVVTSIDGQAGMGKSRLLHAFQTEYDGPARILLGQCNPATRNRAFAPFAEILRAAAGTAADAPPAVVITALRPLLSDPSLAEALPLLFATGGEMGASLDDAFRLRSGLAAVLRDLFRGAPTIMVIEDTHWLDDLSAALLEGFVNEPTARAAFILTHRPEYRPDWLLSDPLVRMIGLRALSREQTQHLAALHLKTDSLTPELAALIYEKAEGNPLFAEEILRYLISEDALDETPDGMALGAGEAPELSTGNLQHIVLHRVDALPIEQRELLRQLSAVGRQVPAGVLANLPAADTLPSLLSDLAAAGLIEADPTGREGDWRFSHALLRDAVYSSLLEEQRVRIHTEVAAAYEALAGQVNTDLSPQLAYQFSRAEIAGKAIEYLVQTARSNARVYALEQVHSDLKRAREFLRQNPDAVSDALVGQMVVIWMDALNDRGDFRSLIEVADELLERVKASGEEAEFDRASGLFAMALAHTRDYDRGLQIALDSIARAEARSDALTAAWCKMALIRIWEETCMEGSHAIQSVVHSVIATGEAFGDHKLAMGALYMLAAHYRAAGNLNDARDASRQLRQFADTHDDLRARAYASWSEAVCLHVSDEIEEAHDLAVKGRGLAVPGTADAQVNIALICGTTVLGPTPEKALPMLEALIERVEAFADYNLLHPSLLSMSIMHLRKRRIVKGWGMMDQVMRDVASVGNNSFTRFFLLVRAEIALTIAGKLPELPPLDGRDRRVVNPDKMSVQDVLLALKLKVTGVRQARRDLEYFRELLTEEDGTIYARSLVCEAVLTRRRSVRKACLDRARVIAEKHAMTNLKRRIAALS